MESNRKKSDQPMTEGMKIRHYIMDIIYHSGNYPVKLLSIRMLAKKFGVACSTVSLVLDKLEDEGFLTARHGVGVFTNPQIEEKWGKPLPLIGMIVGYGKHFFYGASNWPTLAYLGLGLTAAGFNIRHVQLIGLSEDAVFEEIKNSFLDGLVWADSNEVSEQLLLRLEDAGIPVVTIKLKFPSINNVDYQDEFFTPEAGRAAAAMMNRLIRLNDKTIEHINVSSVNKLQGK